MLASAILLGTVAVVALVLTFGRAVAENEATRQGAARSLALATAVQGVHFGEEAATGFHELFPALFGLPPMPFAAFMIFNLTWLGVWIVSVPGLRSGRAPALFAAWFLAIAGTLNGVAHPLMAVAAGGYFPGLVTSPFIGMAGVVLWMRLRRATIRESVARAWR